jgi:hypothetical protein
VAVRGEQSAAGRSATASLLTLPPSLDAERRAAPGVRRDSAPCVEARDSRGATRRIRLDQDSARAGIPVAIASPFAGKARAWVVTTETLEVDEQRSS